MRGLYQRWRSFASSPAALVVAFLWALLESLVWPVVVDFLIFPLVASVPARWRKVFLAALAGSLVGGAAAYLIGAMQLGPSMLNLAPLVTERMVGAAAEALDGRGAAGLLSQPLSGIPYKVFAYQAHEAAIEVLPYVGFSALARGSRFLAAAVVGALLGWVGKRVLVRFFAIIMMLYGVGFFVGLARVVAAWR